MMASQKLGDGHPSFAGGLKLQDFYLSMVACGY
jgi:hypothetical protein